MPKQLKIAGLVAIVVIAIGVALLYAQPNSHANMDNKTSQTTKNVLSLNETNHDFGTVSMKNGKITNIFKVKNTLSENVTLKKLYTSCMCTVATLKLGDKTHGPFSMQGHGSVPTFDEVLLPNQEADVEVTFDPNAHGPAGVGIIERDVILEGTNGPLANMHIKVNVTP